MKKTNVEKGITLIALIITVVVLLILAVVTIGTIKESKIIEHAQTAKNSWEEGSAKESAYLKLAELQMGLLTISFTVEENEETGVMTIYDDGTINEILNAMGLTIDPSQLNDGKFKIDEELLEIYLAFDDINMDDVNYFIYYIKCKDAENNEKYVKIQLEENEDVETELKITKLNVLEELSTAIFKLNNKILANPNNYKVDCGSSGISNEKVNDTLQLMYNALINEGITIESTELLNSERSNFDIDVIFGTDEVDRIIKNDGFTLYFDVKCSKGSETSIVRVMFEIENSSETSERWLQVWPFRLK